MNARPGFVTLVFFDAHHFSPQRHTLCIAALLECTNRQAAAGAAATAFSQEEKMNKYCWSFALKLSRLRGLRFRLADPVI